MASQPAPVRIPLLGISGKVGQTGQAEELPQGLKRISEVEISMLQDLPERCYALQIPDIISESAGSEKPLGIFGSGADLTAQNDIYALGLMGREPLVCKVIKNDAHSNSSTRGEPSQADSPSRVKKRRKSFMTPTPLHIPESRVSPIPDSAHEMIYLKGINDNEALKVVPLRDVIWMHPLIFVMENPPG
jgi:hypothetical protein